MKTVSTEFAAEAAASTAGWCEVYDIYLKSAISTPWGTVSTLRLTTLPGNLSFFKPLISPEPVASYGVAETYYFWPLKREEAKAESKSTNDKLTFIASNVTKDWVGFLGDVDWYDTPVMIRKVPHSIATLTSDDYVVSFSGLIDSVRVTNTSLQFTCSNDAASLSTVAPRENMHTACRFNWADDQCTAIRLKSTNYKGGTVGASSTTTQVNSSDFTEDGASSGSYGTDLVNALADAAITSSSDAVPYVAVAVTLDSNDNPYISRASHALAVGTAVTFAGTLPTGLSAATTYYVRRVVSTSIFTVSASNGGSEIQLFGTPGMSFTLSTVNSGEDFQVKSSKSGWWEISGSGDLGTNDQGYWLIPDAQAGVANAALKPYIQFDFGSAKTPKVWRISSVPDLSTLDGLPRMLVFFSSSDAATWTHESYFEMPPVGGVLYDVLIPNAASRRYWRICIRSRWGQQTAYTMLNKVYAYENGRHYWANGQITFKAATATVALRNVTRRVVESYTGAIIVPKLPVAPANGDTFIIERGCGRTFNNCAERCNWENFGGFTTLPYQTVIR
jgi:hypothetical protein